MQRNLQFLNDKIFSRNIRTSKKNIISNDKKINKIDFYKNKKPFNVDGIDTNKILVSKRESYDNNGSFEYFIGYNDSDNIRPFCIMFSQMIGSVKC